MNYMEELDAENKCHCKWLKIDGDIRFYWSICKHPAIKHEGCFGALKYNKCVEKKCPLWDNPDRQPYFYERRIAITNTITNDMLITELKIEDLSCLDDEARKHITKKIISIGWNESDCLCKFVL